MHIFYIDDSYDQELCVFSALALPVDQGQQAYKQVRDWWQSLQRTFGIDTQKELHAWKFVSGRGRPSERIITKSERATIFHDGLKMIAKLPGARIFNVIFPKKDDERAFARLLSRINRTLQAWGSHGILICDRGKDEAYTKLTRRLGTYNPIPDRSGIKSGAGLAYRNFPIDRIIEDPFFKNSDQSYFIQLVDFAAYALLRRERPIPSRNKYEIHIAFNHLAEILAREASRKDIEGIIRP